MNAHGPWWRHGEGLAVAFSCSLLLWGRRKKEGYLEAFISGFVRGNGWMNEWMAFDTRFLHGAAPRMAWNVSNAFAYCRRSRSGALNSYKSLSIYLHSLYSPPRSKWTDDRLLVDLDRSYKSSFELRRSLPAPCFDRIIKAGWSRAADKDPQQRARNSNFEIR